LQIVVLLAASTGGTNGLTVMVTVLDAPLAQLLAVALHTAV
jgi:hypothetical protein